MSPTKTATKTQLKPAQRSSTKGKASQGFSAEE
jgi:hypothetical protein